jgi:uncharacterized protein (TIGR00106 family)
MPIVLMEFSIFPVDRGGSLSPYVAKALDVVDRSGLPYRLGPMGTTIEGEYDACMAVARDCFEAMAKDCDRVLLQLRVDYRRDRRGAIDSKTASVERELGRKLRT